MEGISFLTNDHNKKVAVQIDLTKYEAVWEDIYDILVAEARKNEPRIPWEKVKEELRREGKL